MMQKGRRSDAPEPETIELAARVIFPHAFLAGPEPWRYRRRREARKRAREIFTALDTAGFQIVPKEPTAEMIAAVGYSDSVSWDQITREWRAMLAAAPKVD